MMFLQRDWCDRLDYDFSELEKKNKSFLYEFGSLEAAMRQLDIMWEIQAYLKNHPKATIVNLAAVWTTPEKPATTVFAIS